MTGGVTAAGAAGCGMMAEMTWQVGDEVHVPGLGTGVVREVRNRGRYVVAIKGRALMVEHGQILPPERRSRARLVARPARLASEHSAATGGSIDLHGLTVDEAVEALDRFVNDALLAGHAEIRVIHGRGGGRLKNAVHARLRELAAVRHFRVDPGNEGVTIVVF